YDAPAENDGYRILVDRLWPRGVKKEALAFDEWCKTLTPSGELRKAFHSETIDFAAFREAYLQELALHQDEGQRVAALAKNQTLTLHCDAKNPRQNHVLGLTCSLHQLAEGHFA